MIRIRPADERGQADHGWLQTKFSFSFAGYQDPAHTRFRKMRVLNDDVIAPGGGFAMHPHDNMEIITYPISGAIAHEDSAGNRSVLRAGQVQRMSAGTGIFHSEHNASSEESLRLLQIWIFPAIKNIEPSYEEGDFPREEKLNRLRLIVSPEGENESLRIHQNAKIYASILEEDARLEHTLADDRHAWLQVARGRLGLNGMELFKGDGAAVSGESNLEIEGLDEESEFMLFDLN
jgi:quercetin 2,3-dioxygenase